MRSPGPIGGDLLARRYRLIDRVGAGGMSVVWRARDEVLDRLVAVKWLGSELADDGLYRDLVRREAWATARIKHPAVAAVYDYGEVAAQDGQSLAYVVMEMLDGESLSDRLRRGPVPWPETIAICAEVADALATAHEQGVVHRDVSPDNVMLTSSGLRVFDFGIAAAIGEPDDDSTGSTFGTPAYVAPERLDGQPAQTATDVYSLGVLIYEMLTGRPPFPEDTWDVDAPLRTRVAPRPRVAGLPTAVAKLCQRCLAYDPLQRPTAREVAQRLSSYTRAWWRGRIVVAAAAVIVLVAVAIATLNGWGPLSSVPAATPTGTGTGPPSTGASATPTATPSATTTPTVTATPPPSRTSPTRTPAVTATPTAPPVTVDQALADLRSLIDNSTTAEMAADIKLDLQNRVKNISDRLAFTANADVRDDIRALHANINSRATEPGTPDQPRMTGAMHTALIDRLTKLNAALGYPPLA